MNNYEIGDEIEAYCGKCKLDTLHIVTAVSDDQIEKVMCKVCMGYHRYKMPQSDAAALMISPKNRTAKTASKGVQKRVRRDKWTKILEDLDSTHAIEYSMEKAYQPETPIHHEIFGFGVVKNIIDSRKIEVLFHDGEKILVQNLQRP